jgi:hypothetical protein
MQVMHALVGCQKRLMKRTARRGIAMNEKGEGNIKQGLRRLASSTGRKRSPELFPY